MELSFTEKKSIRKNFGKLKEILSVPNLIEVQKKSYRQFLESKEVSNSIIVSISFTWGILFNVTLSSNIVAARIGKEAFFEPEILIDPWSFFPPIISKAPIILSSGFIFRIIFIVGEIINKIFILI